MSQIIIQPLTRAVQQLQDGLAVYNANPTDLHRDGVIQRFEYTIDLAWKILGRVLKQHYDVLEQDIRSKKDIFREAAKIGLIGDVQSWILFYEARNQTSNDYSGQKAEEVFMQAQAFATVV